MKKTERNIRAIFDDGRWHRAGEVAKTLGMTRQTAHRYLSRLVEDEFLVVSGAGRATRYRRRSSGFSGIWKTAGLEEGALWEEVSSPDSLFGSLKEPAMSIVNYAFTELVNNVIDHSGASEVLIESEQVDRRITLKIIDEGIGIFNHIRDRLGLATEIEALQELSKGKTTTMPERHSGEGVFFTSKAVHEFEIRSGSLQWIVDNRRNDMAIGKLNPPVKGTSVRIELDTENARELQDVFAEYTENFEFSKTRTVIRLFAISTRFISRSEAKRLLFGLEKFREVVLDFKGVELVGQGFADEVFRVWARAHPDTHFVPVNMCEPAEFMVERAIRRVKDE
ncbi:MAG: DUF4325 domain-containing protein [Thermoanaerobaculales bacterium]|jgi:anti-sigma regulatory factor (Ser/Thr protein kinase)|nr:DUF4325 domain-containing protein [Thermoanaerobaculales bacterium]